MTNYRRTKVPGATYFFTVNLADRDSTMLVDHIGDLREAVRYARTRHPFTIDAMVVLPEHVHAIWTLPREDADYSVRWRLIKSCFSRRIPRGELRRDSRIAKGERAIWQRRYWEHLIRDEEDLHRHVDYVHFNPVKHGHADRASNWPYSSFHRYVAEGRLSLDWGIGVGSDEGFGERGRWVSLRSTHPTKARSQFASGTMKSRRDITYLRLQRQGIAEPASETPQDVVRRLVAVQAQDYLGSLWAVGLRMREANEAAIEQAIAEHRIVRTWPMRGTLHLVGAADVRWLQGLLAPRVIAANAARIERDYGLDEKVFNRCRKLVEKTLGDGEPITRNALYQALDAARIATTHPRGINIIGQLAQEGLICGGPRAGRQPTFVLLDAWLPPTPAKSREEALAELALRHIRSRGPVTTQDFAWWSGLTVKGAQAAYASVHAQVQQATVDGKVYWLSPDTELVAKPRKSVHLLPPFDEYLVGYKDRSAAIDPAFNRQVIGINGLVGASIVIDGRVVGTWKRSLGADRVDIALAPFRTLNKSEQVAIAAAAKRYGRFLGKQVGID